MQLAKPHKIFGTSRMPSTLNYTEKKGVNKCQHAKNLSRRIIKY